jgi:nucleotidyltransferase/DNA polymerase involved in DNA repair
MGAVLCGDQPVEPPALPSGASLAERVCLRMRHDIFTATGLTASGGVGPTRILAKICSGMLR